MRIGIELETDNAAFVDNGLTGETARLVEVVAAKISAGEREGRLLDGNGNTVGKWEIID